MTTLNHDWQALGKGVSRVIAEAWLNPEIEKRLMADPDALLREKGCLPDGLTARVDTGNHAWKIEPIAPQSSEAIMTIPFHPKPEDISTEELQRCLDDVAYNPTCLPNC